MDPSSPIKGKNCGRMFKVSWNGIINIVGKNGNAGMEVRDIFKVGGLSFHSQQYLKLCSASRMFAK